MRILIAGSSGFIGKALCAYFLEHHYKVYRLVRSSFQGDATSIIWDPHTGLLDTASLEGFDAVINLCGKNIAEGRWTKAQKQELWESRIKSTELLVKTFGKLEKPPKVFINASAIGVYGHQGDTICDETSFAGSDFLAQLTGAWEEAARQHLPPSTRLVLTRFGLVLSPYGGALKKMLLPFRLGLGGKLGSGSQYLSWVSVRDTCRAIHYCLIKQEILGPVNIVGPSPVTNLEFTRTLGWVLRRPTFFAVPKWCLRLMLGEMADALLLSSIRVRPRVLLESGFQFEDEVLEALLLQALRHAGRGIGV